MRLALACSLNSTHSSLPRTVVSQQYTFIIASPCELRHVVRTFCARCQVCVDRSLRAYFGLAGGKVTRQHKLPPPVVGVVLVLKSLTKKGQTKTAVSRPASQGRVRLRVHVARPAWASLYELQRVVWSFRTRGRVCVDRLLRNFVIAGKINSLCQDPRLLVWRV